MLFSLFFTSVKPVVSVVFKQTDAPQKRALTPVPPQVFSSNLTKLHRNQLKASVKSDYACRAMEALALHHPDSRPLRIEEIATREAIPANYLVQILIELKSKGLIRSRRGKAGGYVLAKSPAEITFGDVLRAVQGDVLEMPMLAEARCPEEIKRAWRRIKVAAEGAADTITFEEICAEATTRPQMYYI